MKSIQKDFNAFITKDMSRQEFLKLVGAGLLGVAGITGAIGSIQKLVRNQTTTTATTTTMPPNGYGSSPYGR